LAQPLLPLFHECFYKVTTKVYSSARVTLSETLRKLTSRLVRLTRLRRRRLERGWSLADLSRETGLSARTLSLLERGVREPRPATIALLARVIECEPRDLMEPEQ